MSRRRTVRLLGRSVPLAALMGLIVLVVGAVGIFVATRQASEAAPFEVETTTVSVGDAPQAIASGPLGLWVALGADKAIQRVDPSGPAPGVPIDLGVLPGGLAVTSNAVWVGSIEGNQIHRVLPASGSGPATRPRAITVGETPLAVAVGRDVVWVAAFGDGTLWRVDLAGKVQGEPVKLPEAFPSALAVGFGSLWMTDVRHNTLLRLDDATGELQEQIPVGDSPTALALSERGVWVANANDRSVTQVDPATNSVVGTPIVVGGRPGGVAAGLGYVWVTRPEEDSVIRIDPDENEWTGEVFEVGDDPQAVAVTEDSVWVANLADDTLSRLRRLDATSR